MSKDGLLDCVNLNGPPLSEREMPLCPVHKSLDRSGKLEVPVGMDCIACSLQERVELRAILEPCAPEDQSRSSTEVLAEYLFAPGEWKCPKCKFRLHQRLLRASDMAVGVDKNAVAEPCPNGCGLLRQLTWKESDYDAGEGIEWLLKEKDVLVYWLLRAYQSGHREGWEPGASTSETMDGICSVLSNFHYDPASKDAAEMLKQEPVYFVHAESETTQ